MILYWCQCRHHSVVSLPTESTLLLRSSYYVCPRSFSCVRFHVGAWKFQADLERHWDRDSPQYMEEREHPGYAEGLRHEQTNLLPHLWDLGRPGFPAHSWAVSEQDKAAEGQFPSVPRGEKVGTSCLIVRRPRLHLCSFIFNAFVCFCFQRRETGMQVLWPDGPAVRQQVCNKLWSGGWRCSWCYR